MDDLMARAMAKAEELCTVSPSAVKATKRVLNDMYARDGMQDEHRVLPRGDRGSEQDGRFQGRRASLCRETQTRMGQ